MAFFPNVGFFHPWEQVTLPITGRAEIALFCFLRRFNHIPTCDAPKTGFSRSANKPIPCILHIFNRIFDLSKFNFSLYSNFNWKMDLANVYLAQNINMRLRSSFLKVEQSDDINGSFSNSSLIFKKCKSRIKFQRPTFSTCSKASACLVWKMTLIFVTRKNPTAWTPLAKFWKLWAMIFCTWICPRNVLQRCTRLKILLILKLINFSSLFVLAIHQLFIFYWKFSTIYSLVSKPTLRQICEMTMNLKNHVHHHWAQIQRQDWRQSIFAPNWQNAAKSPSCFRLAQPLWRSLAGKLENETKTRIWTTWPDVKRRKVKPCWKSGIFPGYLIVKCIILNFS